MKLHPAGSAADAGKVYLQLKDDDGDNHSVELSIFDVSMVVSMLYEAQGKAMKQEPEKGPEIMLPINGLSFGEDDNYSILRVTVGPGLHQDFAAPKGSSYANVIDLMGEALANESGQESQPFGSSRS